MSTVSNLTELNSDIEESYTSEFKFRKFKLNWTIKDFEFTFKNMKVLESPRFPATQSEAVKWYLRLEPTELKEGNSSEFKMYLKNTDNSVRHLKVVISFYDSSRIIQSFVSVGFNNFDTRIAWPITGTTFYRLSLNKDKLLPRDVTVVCELTFICTARNVFKEAKKFPFESESIANQLECFIDDEVFKDVKFIVEGKEFHAHKTILAFRSPVFAAMFRSKMSESATSVVRIRDIKANTFELMLRFIYTDAVQELDKFAFELFYAAEKYQIEGLKNLCVKSLCDNVTVDTVVKMFEVADTFSISELKAKAGEFLVWCLKDIEKSKEFVKLLKNRPHLATEIIQLQNRIYFENETYEDHSCEMKFEIRS